MVKIFVDTNILVYSLDQFDPQKQTQCRSLLKSLKGDLRGVISTQVMQEFYVAATSKLRAEPLLVKDILHSFRRMETVIITPEFINDAIDCSLINRLSFRDSLIIVAGRKYSIFSLANAVYQPSIISLETALNYWGIIVQVPQIYFSIALAGNRFNVNNIEFVYRRIAPPPFSFRAK
jgi:predicted nucleic acid-binding protein